MDENNVKKLNDEETKQVNGGFLHETACNSDFLKHIGAMDRNFSTWDLTVDWENCSAKVDDGWAKLGITCVTKAAYFNDYFYLGKKIPRMEAFYIAMDKTGVNVDYSDY